MCDGAVEAVHLRRDALTTLQTRMIFLYPCQKFTSMGYHLSTSFDMLISLLKTTPANTSRVLRQHYNGCCAEKVYLSAFGARNIFVWESREKARRKQVQVTTALVFFSVSCRPFFQSPKYKLLMYKKCKTRHHTSDCSTVPRPP